MKYKIKDPLYQPYLNVATQVNKSRKSVEKWTGEKTPDHWWDRILERVVEMNLSRGPKTNE